MSMCRVFSCVVGRGCLLWPVCFLGRTLLAFSLFHSVFQGQICLLLKVFLDFLLLHSSSLWWKANKQMSSRKEICFFDYTKAFDCMHHNKMWEILKEMGIPDHLTCLLRNLYTVQEATIRTEYRITDWFQIRKGVRQGCILSPYSFNLYEKCWADWSASWNQDCWEKYH